MSPVEGVLDSHAMICIVPAEICSGWWEKGSAMTYRVAVAGASGYAGGEVLRLLLGHPDVDDRRADRAQQRRRAARVCTNRTCSRWPTGLIEPTTPETLAGHDVVFLALPHGQSHELAAQLGAGRPGHRLRRRPPADRSRCLGTVLRRRASRVLAVRDAGAAGRPGRAARHQAGRRARLLPDDGLAGDGAGAGRRAGRARRRRGRRVRHLGRRASRRRSTCSAPR